MRHTLAETKTVVVPISGICNTKTVANLLFGPLTDSIERHLDVPVLRPFIPAKLGFQQSVDRTVQDFHEYMTRVRQVYAHANILMLGHSLGGLLGHEELSRSLSQQYLGLISLSAPHGGIDEHHWLIHRDRVREINNLATDLQGTGDGMVQVGALFDTIVPWHSALHELPQSSRYLQQTGCNVSNRLGRTIMSYGGRGLVEHNAMLHDPATVTAVTYMAGCMLEKAGVVTSDAFRALPFELQPYMPASATTAA